MRELIRTADYGRIEGALAANPALANRGGLMMKRTLSKHTRCTVSAT